MRIEPFGNLEFDRKNNEWYGLVDNISPNNKVELSISVNRIDEDLEDKIGLVKKFAADYSTIVAELFDLAFKKYQDTEFEVSRIEIEKIYFLTAVNLKEDNRTWWLVLESDFNAASVYNHFLRFTMLDRKIIWANFDINKSA